MARKVTTTDVEKLNDLLVKEFGYQLKNPPVDENGKRLPIPASALATVVKYVLSTGWKPTADGPLSARIAGLMQNLPFSSTDEEGEPASEKLN
jgi:hypothetical protein